MHIYAKIIDGWPVNFLFLSFKQQLGIAANAIPKPATYYDKMIKYSIQLEYFFISISSNLLQYYDLNQLGS